MKLEEITTNLSEAQVRTDRELTTQIQIKLRGLGLYPGGRFIDGDYGPRTAGAVKRFCNAIGLPFPQYDETFAWNLLIRNQLPEILENANRDREQIFQNLLTIGKATRLAPNQEAPFLHRDVQSSKYLSELDEYANRLAAKYETQLLPSTYSPYPKRGVLPTIDTQSLGFLHSEIQEACVCLGGFVDGNIQTRWLGRNATAKRQFWSATKIIPLLNVVCEANTKFPDIDIETCFVSNRSYPFLELVLDIVTYRNRIASSNALAAMFKQFQTPLGLETWLKHITGNQQLDFRSGYGERPFIVQPQLIDRLKNRQILNAPSTTLEVDKNYISAYDLTRVMSMLAWHLHLAEEARLPGAHWHSLSKIINTLGSDRARYIEVALETLGLENMVGSLVIISKLGNGFSDSRGTNEITYVAVTQFIDLRTRNGNQLGKVRTLAMTLRGVVKPPRTWVELDARMAAEVTEIIRRTILEQLR